MVFLLRTTVLPDIALAEQAADEATKTHWPAVGWTGLALVLYALALNPLGYVLATSLFFPVVARILDSRKPGRDLIIGVGLSLVIYITFTRFLGVRLPAGLLGGIL
jgi:putative tricarboxylic transport membrane protein